MTDHDGRADRDIVRVVDHCVRYWRQTGVPPHSVDEMRIELEQHLRAAAADGRSIEAVVGADVPAFAEAWAAEQRARPRSAGTATWGEVATGQVERHRAARRELVAYVLGGVVLVAALATIPFGGGTDDNDVWRWLWTISALVLGLGEIATAGFFLLPFALGAGAAAVLAWLDVALLSQWLAFFGVSIVSLAYLQRFVRHQNERAQPRVGANRWVDSRGVVTERIDAHANVGMIRIGGEAWRATTEGAPIDEGAEVVVVQVRGTRLVVEPRTEIVGREDLR